MVAFDYAFLAFYFLVLVSLGFYGSHRYVMSYLYRRHRKDVPTAKGEFAELPKVTIQLPIYNELYVVERLVEAVCKIRYPKDKLQIQVLDDSTDETVEIARNAVAEMRATGIDISYVHRTNREGFKAGALEAGLATAHGDFIAVFDADFVPKPDFLERTVQFFTDDKVGMVQVRWEHLNRDFSLPTQAQAILLDGHFVIEHTARNRSGRFFNFNGTAGIWRRSTIADAGGWQHDTLTEDLDLSYRAQCAGWQFVYVNDAVAPAEVPVEMAAFKSQQHRWAKGPIQVARKLLPTLLRSKLPLKVKFEAIMHLTNNIAYVLMVVLSLLMPIAAVLRIERGWYESLWIDLPMFLAATFSVASFYMLAQKEARPTTLLQRSIYLPMVMSLGIGLCVNNARAVVEALIGYQTGFKRTPKYGVTGVGQSWKHVKYRFKIQWQPFIETAIGVYFTWGVITAMIAGSWIAVPFLILFGSGFLYVGLASLLQRNRYLGWIFEGRIAFAKKAVKV